MWIHEYFQHIRQFISHMYKIPLTYLPYNSKIHKIVNEHQKQSNWKVNFWLDLHSLFPSLLPKLQVPRKAVFYHHQGNKKPMNPPKHRRHKPTEPTSSSQLPAHPSSGLPDSPWEKVTSPPPHQPQCSNMLLFMHIKAKLSSIVCCSHQESNEMCAEIQPHWAMLWFQFICGPRWLDFNLRSDSTVSSSVFNREVFEKLFFFHERGKLGIIYVGYLLLWLQPLQS